MRARLIVWFMLFLVVAGVCSFAADNAARQPLDVLRHSNESVQRFTLDNGMVCLVKEDHTAPVVAIQIWVGSGSVNEGRMLGAGLSHFVEHMIFKGTPTRSPGDISREISDAGGDVNAYTAWDRTVFHTTLPSRNWKVGLDVLADAVMNATFPENEWKRERDVILREFAMNRDDPDRELYRLFESTAYRDHPYRFPVIGYEDIFKAATHKDLVSYFHNNYTPDNMIVVVVGNVPAAEMRQTLESTFAGFSRRPSDRAVLPTEPPQVAPRIARQTGNYEVGRLMWGYHATALNDPDTPALDVLADIVGDGLSSRLNREIREKQKLVYGIDASSLTLKDPGMFIISAAFDPAKEAAVTTAIQQEIDRWSADAFTDQEIEKARRAVLVGELAGLQTMEGQAYSYASGEFYAGDPRFAERYLESIGKVDAKKLREVVRTYLRPDNRTLVVLAPAGAAPTNAAPTATQDEIKLQKVVLSNGMPLIVREDHRLPFVYFCAAFQGGLLQESETNNGITQLMADLLTRGTEKRNAQEIAKTAETLGGYLSPFCGRNSFGLQARCLAGDVDTFADLFADCLLHPIFPEEEVQKQRTIQLAAIQQQREQPFFIADEALRRMLFPNHPYRFTPTGAENSVKDLQRDQILRHFNRLAVRKNVVLALFGDITADRARELAEKYLAGLRDGAPPKPPAEPAAAHLPMRSKLREPRQQAIVLVGYPGVDIRDPRMDALSVIENALSGLSSDLGMEVREKRGLVYFVGAFNRPGVEPGMFAAYAGTRPDQVDRVVKLIDRELSRVATRGLREEEWLRAREQILAAHDMSLQDNAGLAQTCSLNELYGLGYDYGLGIKQRLDSLTLDAVKEAAASLFGREHRACSIVLPAGTDSSKEK